jgi:hypothetical protein
LHQATEMVKESKFFRKQAEKAERMAWVFRRGNLPKFYEYGQGLSQPGRHAEDQEAEGQEKVRQKATLKQWPVLKLRAAYFGQSLKASDFTESRRLSVPKTLSELLT